jgi:hypothetical protein
VRYKKGSARLKKNVIKKNMQRQELSGKELLSPHMDINYVRNLLRSFSSYRRKA